MALRDYARTLQMCSSIDAFVEHEQTRFHDTNIHKQSLSCTFVKYTLLPQKLEKATYRLVTIQVKSEGAIQC